MAGKALTKVATTSEPILNENLEKLRAVFPQFVKDGQIDFDALQSFFDAEGILAGPEKYGLNWAGKSDAFKAIRVPATGTLVPQERESKNWNTTQNLFLEGDNLEVLKLLQKHYANPGKIKMIYIDPPYNTGKDRIYKDSFAEKKSDYYERTGQSESGVKLTSNPESNGRYHSDWLTMMYPRLFLAKNLLKDDGVTFISINDKEVANLRLIMDEIFGEENFIAQLIWNKNHSQQQGLFKNYHEYVLIYARSLDNLDLIQGGTGEIDAGALKKISRANPASEFTFPAGVRVDTNDDREFTGTFGDSEKVTVIKGRFLVRAGKTTEPVTLSAGWTTKDQMTHWFAGNETVDTRGQKIIEFYFNSEGKLKVKKERGVLTPPTVLPSFGMPSQHTAELADLMQAVVFNNPKPVPLVQLFASWFSKGSDIILDFFAGSGTTAHAVMAQNAEDEENRVWISTQLPELLDPEDKDDKEACNFLDSIGKSKNIAEITKERIRRAGEKIGKGDVGFKSFRLAPSNYRQWNVLTEKDDEEKLKAQSKLFAEKPLVDKHDEQSVVYEVLLKEGLDLNVKVKKEKSGELAIWSVISGGHRMIITLAPKLTREQIDSLGLAKEDTFVCLDSALDDSLKVNLSKNFNVKVI